MFTSTDYVLHPAEDNINYDRPWLKYYSKHTLPNIEYPNKNLYQMIEFIHDIAADKLAIDFMGYKFTYDKLLNAIDDCALSLYKLGVRKGDKVTVCLPNMPQATIVFYAINKIGAISNMIHPLSAPKEIEFYMKLTDSKFLFTTDLFYSNFKKIKNDVNINKVIVCRMQDYLRKRTKVGYWVVAARKIEKILEEKEVISWKNFMKLAYDNSEDRSLDVSHKSHSIKDEPAVILYSGGTTGNQKGIVLSNLNFNALSLQTGSQSKIEFGDKMMCIMPFFHGFGLGVSMHTALTFGGLCILVPKFTIEDFAKAFKKHKPQFIAGVPTLFTALTRNKKMDNADFSCLKGVFSGGDTLPNETKLQFEDFISKRGATVSIMEGYGLTETVTASCLTPPNEYRVGSVGIPFPDTLYKIVEVGSTKNMPNGEDGEICVYGPTVMLEYYKNPEETDDVLKVHDDGFKWLHTGDLGYMDDDGFVYFKQRIKRIIKSSGYSVFPTQIENVLLKHNAVLDCCVVGVPDDYQIERIRAYVVLKDNYDYSEELESEILSHCREYLAKWSSPREFVFRDSLPLTNVGKISFKDIQKEIDEEFNFNN